MESRTQAEDKAHSFLGPMDDSFRNTLGLQDQMQSSSCAANRTTAFPNAAADVDMSFHAGPSLMKCSNNLPTRRWPGDRLSSLHSGPALNADPTPQHPTAATFDHARLLAMGPDFGIDSGLPFQVQKGHLAGRSSRSSPSGWMEQQQQQQMYKYNLSSATSGEIRQHKSPNRPPTTLTSKAGLFTDHTHSPSPSPSPSCTMAYQDNWYHQQRMENFGIQQMVQSPGGCPVATVPPYSQPLDRHESPSLLSTVSRESDLSPLDSNTPMSTPRYVTALMNHHPHSPSVPVTRDNSEPPCQQYQVSSAPVTMASHTPPPPRQILRSQTCDVPTAHSWHSEPLDGSVFQYASPHIQPHESEQWWAAAQSQATSNRDVQHPFSHASYASVVTPVSTSFGSQPQHYTNTPESLHNSGLMINMNIIPPNITTSSQEPVMTTLSMQKSEAESPPTYSTIPFIPSQHLPQAQLQAQPPPPIQTPSLSIPISVSAPTIPTTSRSTPLLNRRQGVISQQTLKHGYPISPHHRRVKHSRKAHSFSGQATKATKSNPSNTSMHPNSNNYNPIANKPTKEVRFLNLTQDDKQVIINGVAPSGSSKTKARREQEARDKERKITEEMMMAFRQAGGDVKAIDVNGFIRG